MDKRIDWKMVAKVKTLKEEGKLRPTEIAKRTGLHRRQIYRYLNYAKRESCTQ